LKINQSTMGQAKNKSSRVIDCRCYTLRDLYTFNLP